MLVLGVCCVLWGSSSNGAATGWSGTDLDILPATAAGPLTVLHLSDLHFVRRDPGKARVPRVDLPAADVTVVTGDFLAEPEAVETTVAARHGGPRRLASWFVLGSNDYFVPRPLNYLAYFRGKRKPRRAERGRAADAGVAAATPTAGTDLTNVRRDVDIERAADRAARPRRRHISHGTTSASRPRRSPDRFGFAVMHSPDSAPRPPLSATTSWSPATRTAARCAFRASGPW